MVEHSLNSLIGERVTGLALGYVHLNDHDHLRHDPLIATLEAHGTAPKRIVVDLDTTDDEIHGGQGKARSCTGTTDRTVTFRCTSSAVSICCAPGYDSRTSVRQRERSESSIGSSLRSVTAGRKSNRHPG